MSSVILLCFLWSRPGSHTVLTVLLWPHMGWWAPVTAQVPKQDLEIQQPIHILPLAERLTGAPHPPRTERGLLTAQSLLAPYCRCHKPPNGAHPDSRRFPLCITVPDGSRGAEMEVSPGMSCFLEVPGWPCPAARGTCIPRLTVPFLHPRSQRHCVSSFFWSHLEPQPEKGCGLEGLTISPSQGP